MDEKPSVGKFDEYYSRNASQNRQPTAISAHNLNDESPRVTVRGRIDVVDSLTNTVYCGRRTDG